MCDTLCAHMNSYNLISEASVARCYFTSKVSTQCGRWHNSYINSKISPWLQSLMIKCEQWQHQELDLSCQTSGTYNVDIPV